MKPVLLALAGVGVFIGAMPEMLWRAGQPAASGGAVFEPAKHDIQVTPWGPSQETIDAAQAALQSAPSVQTRLAGTRSRLLWFELVDQEGADRTVPPDRYQATYFDYTNNRAWIVIGRFDGGSLTVKPTKTQPEPSEEEFKAAVEVLSRDPEIGPALRDQTLAAYMPMPPLVNGSLPIDQVERTVAVGLTPRDEGPLHQIVGVNMLRGTVVRFKGGAPEACLAAPTACGPPNAGQSTTSRGTAGQFNIVISRAGVEIWNMIAIRPSASGGTRGSGVELTNVSYRGRKVLARAMVPILNVQYQNGACGPYRDWQWQEGSFSATGTNVAAGVRRTTTPPQTILENGTDTGNFRGLAFHDDGTSVTLMSEMQAGWYRYITKWTFKDDGVIQPRFGFGGVNNTCVCNVHNHHAYWRFNFDIAQAASNSVCQSTADPAVCTGLSTEAKLATVGNYLEIRNNLATQATQAYRLVPGLHDGAPDAYSKATAWVLAYQSGQVDDGVNCTQGRTCQTSINIDRFVSGQSITNRDVVVWYRGSFVHDETGGGDDHDGGHLVGPDLVPRGW